MWKALTKGSSQIPVLGLTEKLAWRFETTRRRRIVDV